MTQKQIDNISLTTALKVLKENKSTLKVDFKTQDSDIKAAARKILRDQKKQNR